MSDRLRAGGARLGAWLRRVADVRQPPPAARRRLLAVGALVFLGGAVAAARALELPPGGVRVAPIVVTALLVPVTIAINAAELVASGRLLGQRLGWVVALRVVTLGTAANLLPLPGAAALRVQALAGGGATYAAATGVNLAAAVTWLGTAAAVAGIALLTLGQVGLGGAVLAVGLAAAGAGLVVARRVATVAAPGRDLAFLAASELATVLVHAARLVLLLAAIGAGASFAAATVVGTSGPLAAAAGVFPAGLGVAEALAAGAGALVEVPAAAAFTAAALNRLIGHGLLGVALAVPALRRRPVEVARSAPPARPDGDLPAAGPSPSTSPPAPPGDRAT